MEVNTKQINENGIKVIAASVVFLAVAAVAVVLRLCARRIKGVQWTLNDFAVMAALVGLMRP